MAAPNLLVLDVGQPCRQCYKPFLQEIKIVPHFNLHFIVFKVGSIVCFYTNGPIPASFSLFSSFPHYTIQYIDESVDSVLGIRTRGGRMEGADESTELWRHPQVGWIVNQILNKPLKLPMGFWILPKWQNFNKSRHIASFLQRLTIKISWQASTWWRWRLRWSCTLEGDEEA